MANEHDRLREIVQSGVLLRMDILFDAPKVIAVVDELERCTRSGGRIFFCGNGGSAGDALHLAAEWTIRLRSKVERPSFAAHALGLDPVTLSAAGNDYGYDQVFARPLSGLGREGDVLVGITTSGRSPNVVAALAKAREMGIATIGLLGGDGGPALPLCDHAIVVQSTETARVQEVHITLGHTILELVEDRLMALR